MPVPESSGWAGHPLLAHSAAISATIAGSVTRRASPATITSKPCVATLIVQRGSRATFIALAVRAPVWNQQEPACHSAPTLVTCGLPSAFRVVSQNVERFGERGSSCVRRSASCVSTWDHSIVGSPSASPRLVVSIVLETPPLPETHREVVRSGVSGLVSRGRDSALVGDDDSLCTVAQVELAQDAAHMRLHGPFAEHEAIGDLRVRESFGDVTE